MWVLLLSRNDSPPGTVIERRHFDSGEMIIGRSHDCDWAIDDPDTVLSRRHAIVRKQGLDLYVEDNASGNGVYLNDPASRIAPQQPVQIRVGDRLFLGDFTIEIASALGGIGAQTARQAPPLPPPPAGPIFGIDDGSNNPGIASASKAAFEPKHDFLMDPAAPPVAVPDSPFAPISTDALPAHLTAPAPPFPSPFLHSDEPAGAIPSEWLQTDPFGPETNAKDFAARNPLPVFAPPPPPPEPGPEPASEAPPAPSPAPAPAVSAAEAAAGWEAFCRGAGLDPAEMPQPDDAMWEELGAFYRQTVIGLSDLIRDRATFKREFRIEATQIALGRNNPLKWLGAKEAGKLLLHPPLPGYIGSEDAAREAVQDVKTHQMGMMAGVQQVMASILEELSPEAVDAQIKRVDQGKRGGLFGKKGSDPWTVYRTIFDAMQKESRSTDRGKLSDAFRRGYERFLKNV